MWQSLPSGTTSFRAGVAPAGVQRLSRGTVTTVVQRLRGETWRNGDVSCSISVDETERHPMALPYVLGCLNQRDREIALRLLTERQTGRA